MTIRRHPRGNENKHCFKKTYGIGLVCVLRETTRATPLLKSFK